MSAVVDFDALRKFFDHQLNDKSADKASSLGSSKLTFFLTSKMRTTSKTFFANDDNETVENFSFDFEREKIVENFFVFKEEETFKNLSFRLGKGKTLKTFVTESQTASSFLRLLTNELHDQHQIYHFILQNKTIMAELVRNGFLNKYNTNFNMFPCVDTYKLTNLPRNTLTLTNLHTNLQTYCWADEQRKE